MMNKTKKHINYLFIICGIISFFIAFSALSPPAHAAESTAAAKEKLSKYLLANIRNHKTKINVKKYNTKFLNTYNARWNFYLHFLLNNPDCLCISEDTTGFSYTYDNNNKITAIGVKYKVSQKTFKTRKQEYTKELNKIVKNAKKKKKVKDRIISVNNQICNRVNYSYQSFGYERDIYGALVKRNAVCMGYAISFKAAMDKMKVPCTFELTKSGDHVWNKVKIGKKWYAVDTTWNDVYNTKYYLLIKKHPCSGKQKSF